MRNASRFIVLLGVFLVVLQNNAFAQNVKAVASFSILEDVVKNVGGSYVDVSVLVGADGDAHEYEPTPQDTILLSKANIVFENGLNFEHWMNKLYEASGSKATRIVVSKGVTPRKLEEEGHDEEEGVDHEDHHDHGEVDPHAWQDVNNVIVYVENVRDGLMVLDPVHSKEYQDNANTYIEKLKSLDLWIKEQTATLKHKTIVTNHDALGYFADRYGFKVVGAVIPSATTEAADPSAKQTAALLNVIKANGVKVVFAENVSNTKLANNLASNAGVVVAPGIYTDALGIEGSGASTYVDMMRSNVNVFLKYLK